MAAGAEDKERFGAAYVTRGRLGQGAFRVLVTDAYERRCAVTGDKTLPVLEAAHIKLYALNGPHQVKQRNSPALGSPPALDLGYVTVTPDLRLEVSSQLRADWQNGREYYAHHGQPLRLILARTMTAASDVDPSPPENEDPAYCGVSAASRCDDIADMAISTIRAVRAAVSTGLSSPLRRSPPQARQTPCSYGAANSGVPQSP